MSTSFVSLDHSTLCAQAGSGTNSGDPLRPPIIQSTTFRRTDLDVSSPHAYSRVSNPTVAALEAELGALEQAPPSVCFSTGLAAETALFLSILAAGDHIICGRSVYGGTTRLITRILSRLGVESTFVDATDLPQVASAVKRNTKLIFIESPANPTLELTDISGVASIARAAGVLLAVDNTFLTPIFQQPLDLGADISVYSTTKLIDGHSAALGGALTSRDEKLLDEIRFIRKSTGAIQTPQNASLTLQGVKTLALRAKRQAENADLIARWLRDRREIRTVSYPSLASDPNQRRIAAAQHTGGHGSVIGLELQGGLASAREFMRGLKLCKLVEHVGSVETLITHSASMTHADVPREDRLKAGITDGFLRISVGIESCEAIIDDLRAGLREVTLCCGEEVGCV
ncbi:MAG: trans-sulfuration enzyme family protein [Phycisphaerales bacterium]